MKKITKEDCKDCVWYDEDKTWCKVEKVYLKPDNAGKINPPKNCPYSAGWRGENV